MMYSRNMKEFREDREFHDLVKKDILQRIPVSLEDEIIHKIEKYNLESSIRKDLLISSLLSMAAGICIVLMGIMLYLFRKEVFLIFKATDYFFYILSILIMVLLFIIDHSLRIYKSSRKT